MLLTLLHVALYSAVTMHVVEPLDAKCRPWKGGPLFITYTAVGNSCAPGGPCNQMPMGDLPRSGIKVQVEDCAKPQPGKFIETGRRCNGARLRKFTGRVPRGVQFSISTPRTTIGYMDNPGDASRFRCPGARGPLRTLTHDLGPRPLWSSGWEVHVPMKRFTWKPDGPNHFRLRWEDSQGWKTHQPLEGRVEGRTPEIVLAKAQRDEQGRIRVRGEVRVTETLRGRKHGRCTATWTWTVRFSIPFTDIAFEAQGSNDTPRSARCDALKVKFE